jgi:hypothetical protein
MDYTTTEEALAGDDDEFINIWANATGNITTLAPQLKCKPQEYYSFNYAIIGTLFQVTV